MHKESGQVVAIKQVPVDTDLQEIIKEISMMQQCDRYVTSTSKIHFSSQCHSSNTFQTDKNGNWPLPKKQHAVLIEPFVVWC